MPVDEAPRARLAARAKDSVDAPAPALATLRRDRLAADLSAPRSPGAIATSPGLGAVEARR